MPEAPTTPDPDAIAATARAKIDAAFDAAFDDINTAVDAATTTALADARAETVLARDDADADLAKARERIAADADLYRRGFDGIDAPDFLAAAADSPIGGFLAAARDHIAAAAKDRTFKNVEGLLKRLPEDRPKRMVERLVVRAYAQGSSTTRAFLRHLVTLTKHTPPAHLEAQVEVALRVHAAECDAEVRDLWDVYAATVQAGPGRELATVQTSPMRRVAGLADETLDGAR